MLAMVIVHSVMSRGLELPGLSLFCGKRISARIIANARSLRRLATTNGIIMRAARNQKTAFAPPRKEGVFVKTPAKCRVVN